MRIFLFTLLTFIASQSTALELFKIGDVFFCNGKQRPGYGFFNGLEVKRTEFSKTIKFKIENKDKLIIRYDDDRKLDFDIKVIQYLDEEMGYITSILAERTRYNISIGPFDNGKPDTKYWRLIFNGKAYSEVMHGTLGIVIYYAECEKF